MIDMRSGDTSSTSISSAASRARTSSHRCGFAESMEAARTLNAYIVETPEKALAMAADKAAGWAQTKVLAVDGLRYMRNPPAGELLRGRMTVMGKDPVGDEKGIVIASHDLLDEAGRLVFSCLTRALFSRR